MDDFEQMARGMGAAEGESARLDVAVSAALELIDGCDHAGITVVQGRLMSTEASTDTVVDRGDKLQYELREGPCVDSVRDHETIVSHDLGAEERWPNWAARVHDELGINSMLTLLLYTDRRSYGALNLYGDRKRAFDGDDMTMAHALAGHVAVAVAAGREIDQLGAAVMNRTVIGQAEGILMERLGLDADQAFAYLKRISQHQNVKLVRIATDIVETRVLPATVI